MMGGVMLSRLRLFLFGCDCCGVAGELWLWLAYRCRDCGEPLETHARACAYERACSERAELIEQARRLGASLRAARVLDG